MHQYIIDTKYSTESLINLIAVEENLLKGKLSQLTSLRQKEKFFEDYGWSIDREEDFSDAQVLNAFRISEEAKSQAKQINQEIAALESSLKIKGFSIRILCGSLLQIAKQGISIVHGKLSTCPPGRSLMSETLKNVIWQGRNQAIHFEEGNFQENVKKCFSNLERDYGTQFSLSSNLQQSLAHEIVRLLEWKEYKNYESDMIDLLG